MAVYDRMVKNGLVFLDTFVRSAAVESDNEVKAKARFREVQLRARDGLLTHEDWLWLKETMDGSTAGPEFHEPSVYTLVTTQAMRDEKNAFELEQSHRARRPGDDDPRDQQGRHGEAVRGNYALAKHAALVAW